MALGVRITSNNLNEKTANVTFIPTTGGTVNIGEVTIPSVSYTHLTLPTKRIV